MKEYLILFIGMFTFLGTFLFFDQNNIIQTYIALGISVFYTLWGLGTHIHRGRVTTLIFTEYLLVSAIAFWVMYFVIWA